MRNRTRTLALALGHYVAAREQHNAVRNHVDFVQHVAGDDDVAAFFSVTDKIDQLNGG